MSSLHSTLQSSSEEKPNNNNKQALQAIEIKMVDERRVLLANIPKEITHEHLILYLEYLSDEVGIEHVHDDAQNDYANAIIITFIKTIGN
jgi:hypothetical protein